MCRSGYQTWKQDMNNICKTCGVAIPDSQLLCSMCYGDPEYGSDGYYKEYLQRIEQEHQNWRELEYIREEQFKDVEKHT